MRISDWSSDVSLPIYVLRVGLRQYPKDANLWLGLGNALMVHGNGILSPAAEFSFRKAIRLAPEQPAPAYFYGLALAQSGQLQQAEKIWGDLLARAPADAQWRPELRSEEHTSELQSLMRISYAVFCLKQKKT